MSNYSIVKDEIELTKFIEWLPELTEDETFYCSLFARKKYCKELIKSNDRNQLSRFISKKDRLIQKLYSLEIKEGNYMLGSRVEAPQESLVTYIMPNPRNVRSATFNSIGKLSQMLKTNNKGFNPCVEVMSCIQKCKSRTVHVDFDFDFKDDLIIEKCIELIGKDAITVIETRGGYHVLADVKKINVKSNNKWYLQIKEMGADEAGDMMLPIVGCVQGGFVPKFVDI